MRQERKRRRAVATNEAVELWVISDRTVLCDEEIDPKLMMSDTLTAPLRTEKVIGAQARWSQIMSLTASHMKIIDVGWVIDASEVSE